MFGTRLYEKRLWKTKQLINWQMQWDSSLFHQNPKQTTEMDICIIYLHIVIHYKIKDVLQKMVTMVFLHYREL